MTEPVLLHAEARRRKEATVNDQLSGARIANRLIDMENKMFRVTLKCHHTGGEFDIWTSDESSIEDMARRVEASVVSVHPSSETELVLSQLHTMLGMRQQLRMPE